MLAVPNAVLALPIVLAGEQDFFHLPRAEDVRLQSIEREARETEWPFSVERGTLACGWAAGQKVALFLEASAEDEDMTDGAAARQRRLVLSVNPIDLAVQNIGFRDLFSPFDSLEELVVRIAPYVTTARRLCDQPPGTRLGHGEL
ncbi:hypothetical protein [Aquibium microcysteis]|uniref:hypothetical protein n=1 Tax=Aquibium microcysteis TaxID=675281 RepID=UPI00165D1163|nr:hypothetical protein [Aquibium microcysteis]